MLDCIDVERAGADTIVTLFRMVERAEWPSVPDEIVEAKVHRQQLETATHDGYTHFEVRHGHGFYVRRFLVDKRLPLDARGRVEALLKARGIRLAVDDDGFLRDRGFLAGLPGV